MTQQQRDFDIDNNFENGIHRLQADEYKALREYLDAKKAKDSVMEDAAGSKMIEVNRAWRDAMRAEGRQFMRELKLDATAEDDEKVTQLLRAMVRGLRLARLWKEVLNQPRIFRCCGQKVVDNVQPALRAIGRLSALKMLFDYRDPYVVATAAWWLLDQMPDRCLPILRDIQAKHFIATAAGGAAHWALAIYDIENAARLSGKKPDTPE